MTYVDPKAVIREYNGDGLREKLIELLSVCWTVHMPNYEFSNENEDRRMRANFTVLRLGALLQREAGMGTEPIANAVLSDLGLRPVTSGEVESYVNRKAGCT